MLKQKVVALCATVAMSSAVLADDLTVSQPVSISHANAFDESKVFEIASDKSLQAVELSETEMKETEGKILPILIGAAAGAWGYHAFSYARTGSIGSSSGAAISAVFGGASAGLTSVSGGSLAARVTWGMNTGAMNTVAQIGNTHRLNEDNDIFSKRSEEISPYR